VVTGGLATGAASYFGGGLTFAAATTIAGGITFGTDTSFYRLASGVLALNHTSTSPTLYFQENGVSKGLIGDSASGMFINSFGGGITLQTNNTNALTIATNQAATFAGAVSVGTGAAVGGATAGAGGLAFPAIAVAVANANTLDDYEEGTWTPAYISSGATFAYTEQYGSYVKVGSLVTLQMRLKPSSVTGTTTNATALTGLPFASANLNANNSSAGTVGLCNVTGGLAISIGNNEGTYIDVWNFGTTNQPIASSLDGKFFVATISYRTA
jgi:hypothetical protein